MTTKMSSSKKVCVVCNDKALGYNFNAVTCESCKAFFRRNALSDKRLVCPFNENCDITLITRRFCQRCRLKKCFKLGMKKELIMSEEDKQIKKRKIEQNRAKRQVGTTNSKRKTLDRYVKNSNGKRKTTSNKTISGSDSSNYNLSGSEKNANSYMDCDSDNSNSTCSVLSENLLPIAGDIVNSIIAVPENSTWVINKLMRTPKEAVDILSKIFDSPPDALKLINHLVQHPGNALKIISKIMNSPFDALTVFTKFMSSPKDAQEIISKIVNSPEDVAQFIRQLMNSPADAVDIMNKFMNTPGEALRKINAMVCGEMVTDSNNSIDSMTMTSKINDLLQDDVDGAINVNNCSEINSVLNAAQSPESVTIPEDFQKTFIINNSTNNKKNKDNKSTIAGAGGMTTAIHIDGSFLNLSSSKLSTDETKNILEDVEDRPIQPNSIESVLCEAIKLEYETYNSLPQLQSDSRELNDAEAAKLNELKLASRALYYPLDDDMSSLITEDERIKNSCEGSEPNPQLLKVINLTAVAIRRLIKMSKKITAFRNMCQDDQVSLLKGGCTEMMIMRSAMSYDGATWKIPHSKEHLSNIKVDVLKLAKGNVYEEHERFIQTFDPKWRTDENIILIMCAILLFKPSRPRVIHSDVIKLEQNSYYYLLRRYLESVYPGCEAKSTFIKLIQKISEVERLNDVMIGVYLDVNPSQIEPLLREIFDLKNH